MGICQSTTAGIYTFTNFLLVMALSKQSTKEMHFHAFQSDTTVHFVEQYRSLDKIKYVAEQAFLSVLL